ncbi:hypothetical protein ACFL1U_02865 [Patescibacteria group bacterium]
MLNFYLDLPVKTAEGKLLWIISDEVVRPSVFWLEVSRLEEA